MGIFQCISNLILIRKLNNIYYNKNYDELEKLINEGLDVNKSPWNEKGGLLIFYFNYEKIDVNIIEILLKHGAIAPCLNTIIYNCKHNSRWSLLGHLIDQNNLKLMEYFVTIENCPKTVIREYTRGLGYDCTYCSIFEHIIDRDSCLDGLENSASHLLAIGIEPSDYEINKADKYNDPSETYLIILRHKYPKKYKFKFKIKIRKGNFENYDYGYSGDGNTVLGAFGILCKKTD